MEKSKLPKSRFDLWLLMAKVNHSIMLTWQRELNQYHIPARQTYILGTIQALGPKATLSELAKKVERRTNVIAKQAVKMEKDGLIKRIKDTPKSRLLKLELTEKGFEMVRISRHIKSIDGIFSSVSEEECQQLEKILNLILIELEKHNPV